MHDAFAMKVIEAEGQLGDVEPNDLFLHGPLPIEVKPQVPTEHEVQNHEQIFIVLKGET